MGAVNDTATFYCKFYFLALHTFGRSSMLALLPLTIDRAIAIILPLKHGIYITKKTCSSMFAIVWFSIIILLINDVVGNITGSIKIEYSEMYHRCEILGRNLSIDQISLFIVPFLLIFLMYGAMLIILIQAKRPCGRFLFTAFGIIATNLIFYTPGVIMDMGLKLGYKASQVVVVTFWYVNGVINPLIYVGSHPKTLEFVKSKLALASLEG